MPIFIAQRLCPHGIYLKVRYYRYKEVSNRVFEIFREVTPIIEPLSIDEAYLDLSEGVEKWTDVIESHMSNNIRIENVNLIIEAGFDISKTAEKLLSVYAGENI